MPTAKNKKAIQIFRMTWENNNSKFMPYSEIPNSPPFTASHYQFLGQKM